MKPHIRYKWEKQYSMFHAAPVYLLSCFMRYKRRELWYVASMLYDEQAKTPLSVVRQKLLHAMRRTIDPILKSIARHERKLLRVNLPRRIRTGLDSLADGVSPV